MYQFPVQLIIKKYHKLVGYMLLEVIKGAGNWLGAGIYKKKYNDIMSNNINSHASPLIILYYILAFLFSNYQRLINKRKK